MSTIKEISDLVANDLDKTIFRGSYPAKIVDLISTRIQLELEHREELNRQIVLGFATWYRNRDIMSDLTVFMPVEEAYHHYITKVHGK